MTKADLYGENLTWHMTDMLGRQYDARKNSAADDYCPRPLQLCGREIGRRDRTDLGKPIR